LCVRPPGPSPGDAVSIKSSKDKRPKRSPGETLSPEGRGISARQAKRAEGVPAPDRGDKRSAAELMKHGVVRWLIASVVPEMAPSGIDRAFSGFGKGH
jgi:hypothetical protein